MSTSEALAAAARAHARLDPIEAAGDLVTDSELCQVILRDALSARVHGDQRHAEGLFELAMIAWARSRIFGDAQALRLLADAKAAL